MDAVLNNFFKKEKINPLAIDNFLTCLIFNDNCHTSFEPRINALRPTSGAPSLNGVCAYQFAGAEPAYRCKDCQVDSTCIQCVPCFKKSDHAGHDYSMLTTGAGGCCDCGDPESWDAAGFCRDHPGPSAAKAQTAIPMDAETASRAKTVVDWVVNFVTDALSSRNNVFLFVQNSVVTDAAGDADLRGSNSPALEYGLEGERLHMRFFYSERNGDERGRADAYFVFLHNSESISFGSAINAVCEALSVTKDQASPLVNLVDQEDFSLVFSGDLPSCKQISKKFDERKFSTTILRAPDCRFLISQGVFEAIMGWLKVVCQSGQPFIEMVKDAFNKPLTIFQRIKLSPMTTMERAAGKESQWSTPNTNLKFYFTEEDYKKLTEIAKSSKKHPGRETQNSLLDLGLKRYKNFFIIRSPDGEGVSFLRARDGEIQICPFIPITYHSLTYDAERDYDDLIQTICADEDASRLDYWIKYYFMLNGSRDLQRHYVDITFKLMVDYDFKASWGVRLLKQYAHLILKYNHFGEAEFNVLDLAVQMFTIQKITNYLTENGAMFESFFKAGKTIIEESGNVHGCNSTNFYTKTFRIFGDLWTIINRHVAQFLFLRKKGVQTLTDLARFFELFGSTYGFAKKKNEHALYQERDCHVIFYIEDSLSAVSDRLCDKLELAIQNGLSDKKKQTLFDALKELYVLLCGSCESIAFCEGGGYDFDNQRVSFVIPMHRLMTRLVLRLLRINVFTPNEIMDLQKCTEQTSIVSLFEMNLRAVALVMQIESKLWVYNGISLLNQTYHYFRIFKHIMLDVDVSSLQVAICVVGTKQFFDLFFKRLELSEWLKAPSQASIVISKWGEDKFAAMVGNVMAAICRLYGCRIATGEYTKTDRLEYEVIQYLLIKPLSFSRILDCVKNVYNRNLDKGLEAILEKIAVKIGGNETHTAKYQLKSSYSDRFDYFFKTKTGNESSERDKALSPFALAFSLKPCFSEIKGLFACSSIFRFVFRVLNFEPFSNESIRSGRDSCLVFLYMAIKEIKSKSLPEHIANTFFRKLTKVYENRNDTISKIFKRPFFSQRSYNDIFTNIVMQREDCFNEASSTRDCSILECICSLNRKEAGALSRYVLFNAAKMNKEAEKTVLRYYTSLEELDIERERENNKKRKIQNERSDRARANARAYVELKLLNFCRKEGISLGKKSKAADQTSTLNCILCRSNETKNPLFMLGHEYPMSYRKICQKRRQINSGVIGGTCLESDAVVDLNSCGHVMHETCFIDFVNTKNVDKMLKESGTFLCPFCAAAGVGIIPVLPLRALKRTAFVESTGLGPENELLATFQSALWGQNLGEAFTEQNIKFLASLYSVDDRRVKKYFGVWQNIDDVFTVKDSYIAILPADERPKAVSKVKALLSQVLFNCALPLHLDRDERARRSVPKSQAFRRERLAVNAWGALAAVFCAEGGAVETERAGGERAHLSKMAALFAEGKLDPLLLPKDKREPFWRYLQSCPLSSRAFRKRALASLLEKPAFSVLAECVVCVLPLAAVDFAVFEEADTAPKAAAGDDQCLQKLRQALHCSWVLEVAKTVILAFLTTLAYELEEENISALRPLIAEDQGLDFGQAVPQVQMGAKDYRVPFPAAVAEALRTVCASADGAPGDTPLVVARLTRSLKVPTSLIENVLQTFLRKAALLFHCLGLLDPGDLAAYLGFGHFVGLFGLSPVDRVVRDENNAPLLCAWAARVAKSLRRSRESAAEGLPRLRPSIAPALINLPKDYAELFELAHGEECGFCGTVPRFPALCLFCGRMLCAFADCCSSEKYGELTDHSAARGGVSVALLLKNNAVLLSERGKIVEFPSPYLNAHGEEDRHLREGKPLRMSERRWRRLNQVVFGGGLYTEIRRRKRFNPPVFGE